MVAAALLDLDEPRLAFEVCDETARPETSEAEVDADFHAGWIALRFLDDRSPGRRAVRARGRSRRRSSVDRPGRVLAGPGGGGDGRRRGRQGLL